jgi:uncharacterized membrane protein
MAYLLLIVLFSGLICLMVGADLNANATSLWKKAEGVLLTAVGIVGILTPIFYLATMN